MTQIIEQTINRIKGSVKGVIIVNYSGSIIRTTFDNNKKQSSSNINIIGEDYSKYISLLTLKAKNIVRDLDPINDLLFLRIKTKN